MNESQDKPSRTDLEEIAMIPPVEEMDRRNEAYLRKLASGEPLVEGVDYGVPL